MDRLVLKLKTAFQEQNMVSRFNKIWFVILFIWSMAGLNVAKGQGGKKTVAQEAIRGVIQFQRIKSDGKKLFMIQMVLSKDKPPVEVERTVLVPVKTKEGIEYRQEIQKRLVQATDEKLIDLPKNIEFKNLKGELISRAQMVNKTAMGGGKLVVNMMAQQTIPQAWKELLNDNVILMQTVPINRSKIQK